MTPPKSLNRKESDYQRKKPRGRPQSGRKFLILTEGEKTEPNYFKKLGEYLGVKSNLEIPPVDGTDPKTLVKAAIDLKSERKKEAQKQRDRINGVVEYDEVWVVFDLEKTHDERRRLAREARDQAKAQNIQVAYSDPSFEYWLLLHEEYTTAQFDGCDKVIERLKKHLPEYAKSQVFPSEFIKKVPTAVRNAKRCRQYHDTLSGMKGMNRNPYTEVDELVRSVNASARENCRLSI